jgi:hypothetical protein
MSEKMEEIESIERRRVFYVEFIVICEGKSSLFKKVVGVCLP